MPADPPVLTRSRGPWRGFGSKGWTPTGAVQRVGAVVMGTVFVAGGLAAIVVSPALKGEFQTLISSPTIAWVVSCFTVAWALGIASFVIWFGGRLLAGCFRRSADRKGRT
jgi:hypothetical protein